MESKKIKILGKEISLHRLPLKGWTGLESVKVKMDDAISAKDFDAYFSYTVQFIEMASSSVSIDWNKVPWYETAQAYSEAARLNSPSIDFPILHGDRVDNKKAPWEYEGRSWFFWLNLFASNYGWNADTVSELDIDTAIGLYQEISLNDQLDKEFTYGLSEIAFPYNTSTKKQEFRPMERPDWMKPLIPKQLPVIKMRKDMLPMGNIINLGEPNG